MNVSVSNDLYVLIIALTVTENKKSKRKSRDNILQDNKCKCPIISFFM